MELKIDRFNKFTFFMIICSLIIPSISFKYFKAYTLLSNKILLITNDGIIEYDPQSATSKTIMESSLISSGTDQKYISFAQFPSEEGGYVFCRLKEYIYIFDESLDTCYGSFIIEASNIYCILNPYRTLDGTNTIIVTYINDSKKLKTTIYQINLNNNDELASSIGSNEKLAINLNFKEMYISNKGISCELMYSLNYTNKLLTCFILDENTNSLSALVFNPENYLSFLYYSDNLKQTEISLVIYSTLNPDKTKSFICLVNNNKVFQCLLYDSESNKFITDFTNLINNCQISQNNMDVQYISEKHEYLACCSESYDTMNFIRLDENLNIKSRDTFNNNNCYTSFKITNSLCYSPSSSQLKYINYLDNLYQFRACSDNNQETLSLLYINETCNNQINATGLNYDYELIQELSSSSLSFTSIMKESPSKLSSLISSTSIKKISPTIPSSLISSTSIKKFSSTILSSLISSTFIKKLSSTIPSSLISSASFKKISSTIPSSLISSTSIKKLSSTIPFISSTSNKKLTSTIRSSLISSTSFKKLISTIIFISSTSIKKELPKASSLLSSTSIITTSFSISTTSFLSTIIINNSNLKIENKSSLLTKSSSILLGTTIPKKIITYLPSSKTLISTNSKIVGSQISSSTNLLTSSELKSPLTSVLYDSPIISKSSLFFSSTSTFLNQTKFLFSSSLNNDFYYDGDVIKGKINKTKEELQENLNELMKIIEIGKKYEINGDDYNVTITPINDTFKSTYVDLTICEQILRKEYNISSNDILTILQIEIDKMNEKALTSQVEYAIYNDKKEKLDLSFCKDVKVKVNYDIKNTDLLNKTMIDYYSELGIDIFDNQDSFFNDLCYPFSISNSDVILQDRILDIYQNYSLCDNGCEYDNIDIENMTVSCSCPIKINITTEVAEPALVEMVHETFKDSNIGVLRCYNLVFNIENKLKNVGFLIFLFLIIFHIICYILYFINGIKYIIEFVYKEMDKNNYISRVNHPKKKKKEKNNSNNNSNIVNDFNSRILINENNEGKYFKNKNFKKNEENQSKLDLNANIKKTGKKKTLNKKIKKGKKNQPIFIFNYKYDNNYYKINKSVNSSKKIIPDKKEDKKGIKRNYSKKKTKKKNITIFNQEKNFPGYYNLIYINANNSLKNRPPESKYILDNYNYEQAIKYDSRDFWRIYYICLLYKENILNTFFFKSPLEIQPLRLSLFIFTYSCDFALNALFYLNGKISDKYHYEGESLYLYIFVNNITITIFSTVFSYLIVKLLYMLTNSKYSIQNLFRSEENLLRKNKKYKVNSDKKKIISTSLSKLYKNLKIKIVVYIIIEFLFMPFFFYFITAFCEVYKDTQLSWLYDSFISFLFSILLELLISFFISFIYVSSIKMKIQFLYNIILFLYRLG